VPRDVAEADAMDDGRILAQLQAVLPGCARLPAVTGKDMYGASRRVASRFQQGRVILMGDAAHVTSTRGGMNMNCGIHDAAALAPAIAAALAGQGDRVDATVAERQRIATECLLPRTDRNVSGGPAWTDKLRETARDPVAAVAYLRTAAMLDMLDRGRVYA